MKEHTYNPISGPRNIRVFTIAPAQARDGAAIFGFLSEVSLDAEPLKPYWALSYTWDDQLPDHEILCLPDPKFQRRGTVYEDLVPRVTKLLVTKNCHAALERMRSLRDITQIWVDSMCINQSDVLERSRQVALMGEIYRKAAKVLVWLGDWDYPLRYAMETMRYVVGKDDEELVRDFGFPVLGSPEAAITAAGSGEEVDLASSDIFFPHVTPESVQAGIRHRANQVKDGLHPLTLSAFYRASWFTRMWTVQEVVLSTPANVIFFNTMSKWMTWAQIRKALNALVSPELRDTWRTGRQSILLHDGLTSTIEVCRTALERRGPDGSQTIHFRDLGTNRDLDAGEVRLVPTFSMLLKQAREKRCREPRDKVFALYGIFKELGIRMPAPDYSKPIGEVYREFTMACIQDEGNLNILYGVPSAAREMVDGLVSWAPDFSCYNSASGPLSVRGSLSMDDPYGRLTSFSASGRSKGRFVEESSRLHLRAQLIDTISYCGVHLYWRKDWVTTQSDKKLTVLGIMTAVASWARMSVRCTAYPGLLKKIAALYGTLIEGMRHDLPDSELSPEEFTRLEVQEFACWYETVTAMPEGMDLIFKPWEMSLTDKAEIENSCAKAISRAAFTPETMQLFEGMMKNFRDRKDFFTTEAGYMGAIYGLVDKEGKEVPLVRPGDRIALIESMNLPMVLRPVDEEPAGQCFQLITHAYVQGIMHGEAWNDPKHELKDISLV